MVPKNCKQAPGLVAHAVEHGVVGNIAGADQLDAGPIQAPFHILS
jgi:hypothetical protein